MLSIPQRSILVAQVRDIIRSEIAAGHWQGWLPAERTLSELLKISRPTLRRALQSLQKEKTVRPVHGRGYEILSQPKRSPAKQPPVTVHLLSPDPLEKLRHYSHLWIEEFRFNLLKSGHDLQLHHGRQYLRPAPDRALARLVAQNPRGVWVLVHSSRMIQRWFATHGVPAAVMGYRHEDCNLPGVAVNMEAVCRHAAGELIRLGHRHIALIRLRTDRAGDLLSDRGFRQGAQHPAGAVKVQVLHYDEETPAAIVRTLQRVMGTANRPTALLMAHANSYATAATWLVERGFRIPADVSLLCREDDSFLQFLVPRPACYQYSPRNFALKISSLVHQLIKLPAKPATEVYITPRYTPGGSVGAPARGEAT